MAQNSENVPDAQAPGENQPSDTIRSGGPAATIPEGETVGNKFKQNTLDNRRVIMQIYPESWGSDLFSIRDHIDYLKYLGVGALLSSPVMEYHGLDRIYSQLVNPARNHVVADEFGGNEALIAANMALHDADILPIMDVVPNHVSQESALVKNALAGDRKAQGMLRFFKGAPHDLGFDSKVNIFGLPAYHSVPQLGEDVYRSATFYPDQWELDALNRDVRAYLEKVIKHYYHEFGSRGFRLDAIAYAGTRYLQTETGTHEPAGLDLAHFLRGVLKKLPGAFSIAEAGGNRRLVTQWLTGERCDMAYDFGYPPAMLLALLRGDWRPLIDYLARWWWVDQDAIWVLFLRIHDELQLRYAAPEHREELIAAYGGEDEEFVCFDRMGLTQRLSQLVPSPRAAALALALTICLDGVPLIFQGDAEGRQGDVYAKALDPRDPSRDPMAWTSEAPLFGWKKAPSRPFAADAMSNSVEAQRRNPMSQQHYIRRFIGLRNSEETMRYGARIDLQSLNPAVWPFVRLASNKQIPGTGDLIFAANAKGVQEKAIVDMAPYRGKRMVRMVATGRAYLDGSLGIKWKDASWITSHEASSGYEVFLKPYELMVLKAVSDD